MESNLELSNKKNKELQAKIDELDKEQKSVYQLDELKELKRNLQLRLNQSNDLDKKHQGKET